jgi:hypothetical protein
MCIIIRGSLHKLRPVQGLRVERMDSHGTTSYIGTTNNSYFMGIWTIRIYNTSLSQTEITALYNYDGLNEDIGLTFGTFERYGWYFFVIKIIYNNILFIEWFYKACKCKTRKNVNYSFHRS